MCNNDLLLLLLLLFFLFFFCQILMSALKESITVVLTLFVAIPKDPTTVIVHPDITERIAAK